METLKAITNRKSTRGFKPEQISDNELNKILDAGCAAPIAMGKFETVHLTLIQNGDMLKKISLAGGEFFGKPGMEALYGAPTLVLVSSKPNEFGRDAGIANSACIIENMCLAATDLGIGSVYIMGAIAAISQNEEILSQLNLPQGFIPVAGAALGYPLEDLKEAEKTERRINVSVIK